MTYVAVICPPTFITTPDSLEATEGKSIKLICKAHGKPIPEITWFKNEEIIKDSKSMKLESKETEVVFI